MDLGIAPIENFAEFSTEDFYYVDKTLFIAFCEKACMVMKKDSYIIS